MTGRLISVSTIVCLSAALTGSAWSQGKRPITVDDAIAMTRLADHRYFQGASAQDVRVAYFSPDKKQFVIVLRKGDLANRSNVYTMYLFRSQDVLHSPQPIPVARMESSSNAPGIEGIKWLGNSQTIAFLGARGDAKPQVYFVDTGTRRLTQKTFHRTAVQSYDVSADGRRVVFVAEPELQDYSQDRYHSLLIEDQYLADLLMNRWREREAGYQLFVQGSSERAIAIPGGYVLSGADDRISLSGNGRYAAVIAEYLEADPSWAEYDDKYLQSIVKEHSTRPSVKEILILDTAKQELASIIGAPAARYPQIHWMPDNQTFTARTFLPIHDPGGHSKKDVPVEVLVPQRRIIRLTEAAWQATITPPKPDDLRVTLQESVDTPPKIYAESVSENRKSLLLDLNPQFDDLKFGKVEELQFSLHGINVLAGLYYPPDYSPEIRYPLVIQTHGFDPHRFSMDGQDEWSSGYAARPLAAKGFMVLQVFSFKTSEDADKYLRDETFGRTPEERAKVLYLRVCEAAIDSLDQRGLIERQKVGISGFSVTVMFVGYILTHSKYAFAAGILTDGVDGNYCQYLESGIKVFEQYNGGENPFSDSGLKLWLQGSPSFRLGAVHTPMRLVALKREDILEMWEWFSALRMQGKPVELIKLPEASHMLERSTDRKMAMEGIVDWFRFWLQAYEDSEPAKRNQYVRWEFLRRADGLAPAGR